MPSWRGPGGLRDMILPRLYDDKESEILVVGCGNSGKKKKVNKCRDEREDV